LKELHTTNQMTNSQKSMIPEDKQFMFSCGTACGMSDRGGTCPEADTDDQKEDTLRNIKLGVAVLPRVPSTPRSV
jgi:hypothetical protein